MTEKHIHEKNYRLWKLLSNPFVNVYLTAALVGTVANIVRTISVMVTVETEAIVISTALVNLTVMGMYIVINSLLYQQHWYKLINSLLYQQHW